MTNTAGSRNVVTRDDPEVKAIVGEIVEAKARKAGLLGAYRHADSELGRDVYEAARRGEGTYLWGDPGTGKTWAAACAVRLAIEAQDPLGPITARLVATKALLDEIKDGYDGGNGKALGDAKAVWLLALDDLGVERPTDWAIETLADLIDARTMAGLPTVVTSNYRIGEIRDIWKGMPGKRTASRLAGACRSVRVTGPDKRLA